jgi:multidrug efflux system membrane fusion protein
MNSNASITNAGRLQALRNAEGGPLSQPIMNVSLRCWFYIGALLLLLILRGITAGHSIPEQWNSPAAVGAQSVAVQAVPARRGRLNIYLNEVGTVMPLKTVTVRARVDGELTGIYFQEGQTVKAGDLLAEIDWRPYQVQLSQARAQMARDRALLIQARAQLARYRQLLAEDAIARQDLDAQESIAAQDAAVVKNDQELIDSARLNLDNCRITSPIDGHAGLRLVDPGNFVRAADARALTVITQLQPVAVIVSIPQSDQPLVTKAIKAAPRLPIDAYDSGFTNELAAGTLLAFDNEVDRTTGAMRLKASFPNEDDALLANQSVETRLLIDIIREAVLIPSAAILHSAQGAFVYLVDPDHTVAIRSIVVAATQDGMSAIGDGLVPGELVVVNGTRKLQVGERVSVQLASDPIAPEAIEAGKRPVVEPALEQSVAAYESARAEPQTAREHRALENKPFLSIKGREREE